MSEHLLPRVARGDPVAVEACIDRYGGLVWSLARRFLPASEAEDAVQEIFVELWQSAHRFDPERGAEPTFVAMIARRRLIDRKRRQQREQERDGSLALDAREADSSDAARVEAWPTVRAALRALEELRPEVRRAVELATVFGLSHAEVARETDLPLGTVKSHIRRGLEQVRKALEGGSS